MEDEAWEHLPMYMGCSDIISLGFKKTTIYEWFRSDDFPPVINRNGYKVNKFKFRAWLENQEKKVYV